MGTKIENERLKANSKVEKSKSPKVKTLSRKRESKKTRKITNHSFTLIYTNTREKRLKAEGKEKT